MTTREGKRVVLGYIGEWSFLGWFSWILSTQRVTEEREREKERRREKEKERKTKREREEKERRKREKEKERRREREGERRELMLGVSAPDNSKIIP